MQMEAAEIQRQHDLRRQEQDQRIDAVATKTVPMPTDDLHTFHPGT
jgi:hypothetical protein